MKDWTADVGFFDLRTFILSNVSVAEAFSVATLLCPRFIEYRDCVFLEFAFEENSVNSWFNELKGDRAKVEAVVNHVHLWDFFAPASEADNEALQDFAARMAETWRHSARKQFPQRKFVVEANDGLNDYGPTVVIYSA
ncbi:hypothetical protein [Nonomuraea maheshkhaliensis]|uniref:hypothetical protein n=1 Tax=Nonomuraea maheshkhaliensis TaxID=419590 RepID=UPI0031F9E79B